MLFLDLRPQEKRWRVGFWHLDCSLPTPTTSAPGKGSVSSLCWIKKVSNFLSPSVSETALDIRLRPHQRSWGSLSWINTALAAKVLRLLPPPPHPSLLSASLFALFYSFSQICLCGKFTARTACLNYLKAQYSRLCHKAFPFCMFYFSVWGPFMKSAARRKEIICILGSIHLEFLNFRD